MAQPATRFGINSPYLGQQLRVKQGQDLPFDVVNNLDEVAAIHWHGLHIPGEVDGGPHQEIEPGRSWSPVVPIRQQASFNWFHAHTHGRAAKQVYTGLAGLMQVEDDASLSADLPKTHGVDDFTIVLQDKAFGDDGKMAYVLTKEGFEDGFLGDALVINGAIAPVGQAVPSGLVRLRILNACNARFLELKMENGPMTVIASDGGFLASAVETDNLIISSGERYEVLVDMSAFEENSLRVASFAGYGAMFGFLRQFLNNQIPGTTVLTLKRNGDSGFTGLNAQQAGKPCSCRCQSGDRDPQLHSGDGRRRRIGCARRQLGQPLRRWSGNGDQWSSDEDGSGSTNDPSWARRSYGASRPMRNSIRSMSTAALSALSNRKVIRQRRTRKAGKTSCMFRMARLKSLFASTTKPPITRPYMYHCHILEHEDCGMMGQVAVSAGAT